MSMLKNPVHPGSILQHEFLEPLSMSSYKLAKCIGVPRTRIERIAAEKTSVSPDTAMRLAKFFGTTPEFWLNLQQGYDLLRAKADTDVSSIKPLDVAVAACDHKSALYV